MTTKWTKAVELGMRGINKPLRIASAEATAVSMDAQFKNLSAGEAVVMQWVIFPDRPRAPTSVDKDKVSENTYHAITRFGAVGERPQGMLLDLYSFHSVEAAGTHFVARLLLDVAGRLNRRAGTFGFGVYMNALELSALLGWPLNGSGTRRAKRIAPTLAHDTEGIILGTSNSPKMQNRKVAIPLSALTVHGFIAGPSGTGKSTLMLNMAAQIMQAGLGLLLIEPKGELADSVLMAVPHDRIDDIVWLDALDVDRPIGVNVLAGSDPERITSHIVGMFKNLSGDSWSGQLQRVMRNAVITAALNGLTLYDCKQLLVNKEYREAQVKRINRNTHPDIIQEWRWLADKADLTVDSAVNRLDAFLGSRMIRNIVSQNQNALDFDDIVRNRKILLVPLSEAHMGQTNASAMGQLIWEMYWNATLRRPIEHREPNVAMIDELPMFSDILDATKSDPWAIARSYGLGVISAAQFMEQLPATLQKTITKNAQTQIMFRLDDTDAKRMADSFAPLKAEDLANLPKFTIAAKVMATGGNAPVVTLKTQPPAMPTGAGHAAMEQSRQRYGRPVAEVEAELLTRHKTAEPRQKPVIGRLEGDE